MNSLSKRPIPLSFFSRDTLTVARNLIGVVMEANGVSGRIVEVEAYTDDEASHGFRKTARSAIMHETYGHVYVYFIYGMYYCVNFTTEKSNVGAVLIRAVEPLTGIEKMRQRRGVERNEQLCSGPGKLCQAFGIDLKFSGTVIGDKIRLYRGSCDEIECGPRIGITKATDLQWRFWEKGNRFVSR